MNQELIYVNLLSKDHKKLIEFYTEVVGLKPLNPNADTSKEKWYGFSTGKTQFAIEPMSNRDEYNLESEAKNPTLIQFKAESVEDLTKWTEKLEKSGVKIIQRILKKSYGTVTTFIDPDDNILELLYQEE